MIGEHLISTQPVPKGVGENVFLYLVREFLVGKAETQIASVIWSSD